MGTPAAEITIDAALVRRLLADQHPDLAGCDIAPLASGWDNEIFRLGEGLAIRLPRRSLAATLVAHEQRWLPTLAPRLPVPISVPVRVGVPQPGYPWAWSITRWIEGDTADRVAFADGQELVLASFMRALHVAAPADAPRNPYRGVPLAERIPVYEQRLSRLAGRTDLVHDGIREVWADALAAPAAQAITWIHGDLHPRNVLVHGGRIAGIIDWGDIAQGDPATDLASLWMLVPAAAARRRAMAALDTVTVDTWRRARGWATLQAMILLDAGLADDPQMAAIGRTTLARLTAGP